MPETVREYGLSLAAAALCTAACLALDPLVSMTDLVMVYLVGTFAVALRGRRGPALLSSGLGVLCFNFFFVPPRLTFQVAHPQYLVTFGVMFGVALLISHLAVRVRAQAEATKRAEIAGEADRIRSSLLSGVSHELRTPLAAIIGSPGPCSGSPGPGRASRAPQRAEQLAGWSTTSSNDPPGDRGALLRKRRIPGGSDRDGVGHVNSRADPSKPTSRISLWFRWTRCDGTGFRQPHRERRPPRPGARFRSRRERMDGVEISVADRGPGLAPEDLSRVFEKFYRAGKAVGGAGLGLAICKAVVEAHGGAIRAENRRDGGAVFLLTLPRKESP